MNTILFSVVIGILIAFTNKYFFFFKNIFPLKAVLIDISTLSLLTYTSINILSLFEGVIFVLVCFLLLTLYFLYMIYVSSRIYLKFSNTIRAKDLEGLYFKEYNKNKNILIHQNIDKIRVLRDNKNILIPSRVMNELELNDIINILAFKTNKGKANIFFLLYIIPLTIFYWTFTNELGNRKVILILIASSLIFVIKRILFYIENKTNLIELKNKLSKQDLISSLKKYYLLLSQTLTGTNKAINNSKMKKTIETVNKYL